MRCCQLIFSINSYKLNKLLINVQEFSANQTNLSHSLLLWAFRLNKSRFVLLFSVVIFLTSPVQSARVAEYILLVILVTLSIIMKSINQI